jgi:hypothetical protein
MYRMMCIRNQQICYYLFFWSANLVTDNKHFNVVYFKK